MELVIETGFAMPKSSRKSSAKESAMAKLFKELRPTIDQMEPGQSVAFEQNNPTKMRRELIWALNKYGLKTGKRFAIIATEPTEAIPATDTTEAIPAKVGTLRVGCLQVGLAPEQWEAGESQKEKFEELFADAAIAAPITEQATAGNAPTDGLPTEQITAPEGEVIVPEAK
jgi:hypothetical protein